MEEAYRTIRPRLDGLTDEEFFWEPVPGCWSVRPVTEPKPPALFQSTPTQNTWFVEHGWTGMGTPVRVAEPLLTPKAPKSCYGQFSWQKLIAWHP